MTWHCSRRECLINPDWDVADSSSLPKPISEVRTHRWSFSPWCVEALRQNTKQSPEQQQRKRSDHPEKDGCSNNLLRKLFIFTTLILILPSLTRKKCSVCVTVKLIKSLKTSRNEVESLADSHQRAWKYNRERDGCGRSSTLTSSNQRARRQTHQVHRSG